MTAYRRSKTPTSWHLSTGPDTLQYASDDGTPKASSLSERLYQRGLRTRPTARYPAQRVSISKLARMLRDRYYLGYITTETQNSPAATSRSSTGTCSTASRSSTPWPGSSWAIPPTTIPVGPWPQSRSTWPATTTSASYSTTHSSVGSTLPTAALPTTNPGQQHPDLNNTSPHRHDTLRG
jgi:hypothetical protein